MRTKKDCFESIFNFPKDDFFTSEMSYKDGKLVSDDMLILQKVKDDYILYLVDYHDFSEFARKIQKSLIRYLKKRLETDKELEKHIKTLTNSSISKNVNIELLYGHHTSLLGTEEWQNNGFILV